MLIAALLSPATAGALDVARAHGEIAWSSVRQRDGPATTADLEAAARIPAAVLLLDAGAGPPDALLAGARQYRVTRPETRVIALAPGRVPGDPTVAGLVALGVYDILAPGGDNPNWADLLHDTLTGPPATYAHAARWSAAQLAGAPLRTAPQGARIERVPVVARPIIIAVGAVAEREGSTHTALTVTSFLARQGYRVALVEACPHPVLARVLHNLGVDPGLDSDGTQIMPGVVLYTLPVAAIEGQGDARAWGTARLAAALGERSQHQYVVLDLGPVQPDDPELARADLTLIAASPAPWRAHELVRWEEQAAAPHLRLVFTPANEVPDTVHERRLRAEALPWLAPDLLPFCHHVAPEATKALARILEPVLLHTVEPTGQVRLHHLGPLARRAWRRIGSVVVPALFAAFTTYLLAAWAYLTWAHPDQLLRPPPLVAPGAVLLRAFKFLIQSAAS